MRILEQAQKKRLHYTGTQNSRSDVQNMNLEHLLLLRISIFPQGLYTINDTGEGHT